MRLFELICELKAIEEQIGNIDVYVEENDGHSTWASNLTKVKFNYRKVWHNRPASPTNGPHYIIELTGNW